MKESPTMTMTAVKITLNISFIDVPPFQAPTTNSPPIARRPRMARGAPNVTTTAMPIMSDVRLPESATAVLAVAIDGEIASVTTTVNSPTITPSSLLICNLSSP